MVKVSAALAAKLKESEEFNAEACYHCGTCTALCPLDYDIVPRQLFRDVLLGLEEKVKASVPAIYSCLLCRMCEEYCPEEVHIAENIRYLRKHINQEEFKLP
ncbi:MAG: 4Fe-4S dicluster domain-containing protein [Chloroflexota bacterium]|nr:4Fe-4S dicluster domain-containing protein [Chloroflexota bacterium]